MCVVCGCGGPAGEAGDLRPRAGGVEGLSPPPEAADWTAGGALVHPATGDLHYGAGEARVSVPGLSPQRAIRLEADVLGENNRLAAANRRHFRAHGVTALNLVSGPGSGKTTLLCATIAALHRGEPGLPLAVIEGDQQTSVDADRIRATGAPAIQVNTGKGCHLDAAMVSEAFVRLPLHDGGHGDTPAQGPVDADADADAHAIAHGHRHEHPPADGPASPPATGRARRLLFIENVGNLVCPAMWDLGEAAKVAILSVTEGEDKPLKYPDMFAAAELMLLNKIDLLPHVSFDVAACIAHARRVNPGIEVLQVSARTGEGMDAWIDWLMHCTPDGPATRATGDAAAPSSATEAALRRRIAELEAEVAALRRGPSA